MREKLLELIPEFNMINDSDLKERTIRVWEKALKIRKMQPEDMLRMPFTLLIKPCPVNFVEHSRGVVQVSYAAAQALQKVYGDKIPINMEYRNNTLDSTGPVLNLFTNIGKNAIETILLSITPSCTMV